MSVSAAAATRALRRGHPRMRGSFGFGRFPAGTLESGKAEEESAQPASLDFSQGPSTLLPLAPSGNVSPQYDDRRKEAAQLYTLIVRLAADMLYGLASTWCQSLQSQPDGNKSLRGSPPGGERFKKTLGDLTRQARKKQGPWRRARRFPCAEYSRRAKPP